MKVGFGLKTMHVGLTKFCPPTKLICPLEKLGHKLSKVILTTNYMYICPFGQADEVQLRSLI
jgi:hypothetical protein